MSPRKLGPWMLLAACGGSGPASATMPPAPAPHGATCSTDAAKFDAWVATLTREVSKSGASAVAVSIACGGTIYSAGIGTTSKTGGEPVDGHTRFNVGSTQKPFTAALAMRLVQDGTMSLDDTASRWAPGINTSKPYYASCTFAQLLSHTSGYPAIPPNSDNAVELGPFFEAQKNALLWSPPGAVFDYNNMGFELAGYMMQNATHTAFGDLVEQKVFGPAGMADARMDPRAVEKEGHYAMGYSGGHAVKPSEVVIPVMGPDTGGFASADDLAHFADTMMSGGGAMLRSASVTKMTTPQTPSDDPTQGAYGFGLFLIDLHGTPMWTHDGENTGYVSDLVMLPDADFAYSILMNDDSAYPPKAYFDAYKTFMGKDLPQPPGDAFDPADMPDHVGTYESVTLGTLTVAKSGSEMKLTVGGSTVTMHPAWKDTYFFPYKPWGGGSLELNFWRADKTVKYAVTRAGVGTRKE